ncbi:cytochrome P460 family protein [Photobacterium arenosum]|uniref:cytochrome P460 family protein n=1 Tax=Photobacterium arenosum TaxID=2774143 RepID=UPI00288919CC|nr:cytochrome P460 family protein [Photobacterium arenosum]
MNILNTAVLTTTLLLLIPLTVKAESSKLSPFVNTQGHIMLPADFRTNLYHIGSWFVPQGEASGFHDVYMDKIGISAFRSTGKYADGTVIVKELRHSKTSDFTTGKGVAYATDEIKQIFVMIKDTQNRFLDNPNWGDGWGWALFKPGQTKNISSDYRKDCLGCHLPVKDKDLVYSDYYPTLKP